MRSPTASACSNAWPTWASGTCTGSTLRQDDALRGRQAMADKAARTAKRQRTALSPEFIAGYRAECLAGFDSARFVAELGPEARVVALLCVERDAAACHRSLLAEELSYDLGLTVTHIVPGGPPPR